MSNFSHQVKILFRLNAGLGNDCATRLLAVLVQTATTLMRNTKSEDEWSKLFNFTAIDECDSKLKANPGQLYSWASNILRRAHRVSRKVFATTSKVRMVVYTSFRMFHFDRDSYSRVGPWGFTSFLATARRPLPPDAHQP